MFRIVCDPSSGSIELYLTEIIRNGSLMFVVCLVGVWQRIFEPVVCLCVCVCVRYDGLSQPVVPYTHTTENSASQMLTVTKFPLRLECWLQAMKFVVTFVTVGPSRIAAIAIIHLGEKFGRMDVWGLNQELLSLHWLKRKAYCSGEGPPLRGRRSRCLTFNHIMVFGLHVTEYHRECHSNSRHKAIVIYAKEWRLSWFLFLGGGRWYFFLIY